MTSWWFPLLNKNMKNITEQNGQRLVHAKNSLWAARTSNFQHRPRLGNLWTPITMKNLSNLCCITPHVCILPVETFAKSQSADALAFFRPRHRLKIHLKHCQGCIVPRGLSAPYVAGMGMLNYIDFVLPIMSSSMWHW